MQEAGAMSEQVAYMDVAQFFWLKFAIQLVDGLCGHKGIGVTQRIVYCRYDGKTPR